MQNSFKKKNKPQTSKTSDCISQTAVKNMEMKKAETPDFSI